MLGLLIARWEAFSTTDHHRRFIGFTKSLDRPRPRRQLVHLFSDDGERIKSRPCCFGVRGSAPAHLSFMTKIKMDVGEYPPLSPAETPNGSETTWPFVPQPLLDGIPPVFRDNLFHKKPSNITSRFSI